MRANNFITLAIVDYTKILRICTFEYNFIVLCIFSVRQVIYILCFTDIKIVFDIQFSRSLCFDFAKRIPMAFQKN